MEHKRTYSMHCISVNVPFTTTNLSFGYHLRDKTNYPVASDYPVVSTMTGASSSGSSSKFH